MGNCPHGKNLATQVCKYCSCPHGAPKSNCAFCSKQNLCKHGTDLNSSMCLACEIAARPTGAVNVRMPATFGLSPEQKRQHDREVAYLQKVQAMDKERGALRMFRTWVLTDDNVLRAMTNPYEWKRGENMSTPMSEGASRGFYGFSSLAQLQRQEKRWWQMSQSGESWMDESGVLFPMSILGGPTSGRKAWYVSGTFLAYGHVIIAEHGGKAHYAVPEYVIEPDGSDPDFGMRIVMVAEKYGMEIISVQIARELKVGMVPYVRKQDS